MYFIINKTKRPVIIGDLNFELKPRQAIDMDLVLGRHQIDSSRDLKAAIAQGIVVLRQETKKSPKNAEKDLYDSGNEIGKMKDELKDEIKKQLGGIAEVLKGNTQTVKVEQPDQTALLAALKEALQENAQAVKVEQPDQTELLSALKHLTDVVQSAGINIHGTETNQVSTEDEDDLDPAEAEAIHAKTVDKLAKGLKSHVDYKEEKTDDQSIKDRADELDNILGE